MYTVITGDYDAPPAVERVTPGIRCVCFADALEQVPEPWELIPIEPYFRDSKLTSGYLKSNPHLLFDSTVIAVWVDANLKRLRLDGSSLVATVAERPVAAPRHRTRSTVTEEAQVVAELGLDEAPRVAMLLQTFSDDGYLDDQGLAATMLLVRDLSVPALRRADALWWNGILRLSRRDQLTFNHALWSNGLAWNEIDVDYEQPNRLFVRRQHGRPSSRRIPPGPDGKMTGESGRWATPTHGELPPNYPNVAIYPDESWTEVTTRTLRSLNALVAGSQEPMEGNYCHHHHAVVTQNTPPDPRRSWKREFLRRAAAGSISALEIGFNAGHSATVLLGANPKLRLTSVDLGEHAYSEPCADQLAKTFPQRFEARWGDSADILPALPQPLVSSLDLVHIDGGHGEEAFLADLRWFLAATSVGCLLVVDDVYVPRIEQPLADACAQGLLAELQPGFPSSGENRLYRRTI